MASYTSAITRVVASRVMLVEHGLEQSPQLSTQTGDVDADKVLLEPNTWPHGIEECGIHGRVFTVLLRTSEGTLLVSR